MIFFPFEAIDFFLVTGRETSPFSSSFSLFSPRLKLGCGFLFSSQTEQVQQPTITPSSGVVRTGTVVQMTTLTPGAFVVYSANVSTSLLDSSALLNATDVRSAFFSFWEINLWFLFQHFFFLTLPFFSFVIHDFFLKIIRRVQTRKCSKCKMRDVYLLDFHLRARFNYPKAINICHKMQFKKM